MTNQNSFSSKNKFRIGKYLLPVAISPAPDNRLYLQFGYHPQLVDEVKNMEGAKWHPSSKTWSIANSPRNAFSINYLTGGNPYADYDKPLIEWNPEWDHPTIPFYVHQKDMVCQGLTRHYTILAAEMGTGKTRAAFKIIEISGINDILWVGPKSSLIAIQLEQIKWKLSKSIRLRLMTYEGMVKLLKNWSGDTPRFVVFDESQRIKNPTSQRGQSARYLAHQVRQRWDQEGFVLLMTGTPAPKDPTDWWNQCESACPGYLREGDKVKLKRRLAIVEQRESITGQIYPHLLGWKDDPDKCAKCGRKRDEPCHNSEMSVFTEENFHVFVPTKNEIEGLYRRLKGLVMVKLKKDCLSLPDFNYRIIRLKPSRETLNLAELIRAKSTTAIQALTLQRELSDGFQYVEEESEDTKVCPNCHGLREKEEWDYTGPEEDYEYHNNIVTRDQNHHQFPHLYESRVYTCPVCDGTGSIRIKKRETKEVDCPKEDALKELLDEYEDVGRFVCYAGFTGSIDRVCRIVKECKWNFIRVDGRGWVTDLHLTKSVDMLQAFQDKERLYERIVFIGHPGSAGMGLTLTESPVVCYYSNDFNGESRIQSQSRIHRPGMDINLGATVIDLLHLPCDEIILNNVKEKRRLEAMTLGDIDSQIKEVI